ncbi:MAG: phosphodiester glycosidase family protein [Clostridia bacterium]|nr:phosphodiester glycosidase family protein [Clostridia bacterium]
MKTDLFTKIISILLCFIFLIGIFPIASLAVDFKDSPDGYYSVISKTDWELAPGITESEIILNNAAGSKRQVNHVVEIDIHNPYTKVMPSAKGMAEGLQAKKYGTQVMSEQAKYAEEHGYGNVVAAMNTTLHWYDTDYYAQHPELVGEPLGLLIMDGVEYSNSQSRYFGAWTCLVINFDEKDGVKRPDNIPKTEIRQTYDAITGWEEQVIPANFHPLLENGKNIYGIDDPTEPASRSFMGVKADGTIVLVVNEGRLAPHSVGFNCYEMAEFMLSLGCVYATNGDGGGSSTFLSQRPGEELKMQNKPSDGAERPTTNGVLVISTAPASGTLDQAHISSEYDYYTPGSTVSFSATGTDYTGAAADIPVDAVWQLTDPSFGTVERGIFVSNGKLGDVTVQLSVEGEIVGEHTIHIAMPDKLSFASSSMVVAYGAKTAVVLNASYQGNTVVLKESDVSFSLSDNSIGSIDGFYFTATAEGVGAASGVISATVGSATASASITLGNGSNVVYTFENEGEIETEAEKLTGWSVSAENGACGNLHVINKSGGKVKNGDWALAFECDFTTLDTTGNNSITVNFPALDTTDATAVGFWLYAPYEARNAEIKFGNGGIEVGELYDLTEGWNYISAAPGGDSFDSITVTVDDNSTDNTNLNGRFVFYIDDITVDYSEAVDDRYAPVFSDICVIDPTNGAVNALNGQTVGYNKASYEVSVAENTDFANASGINERSAQAFIDGVEVACTYKNEKITLSGITLADGIHTVMFKIADNKGNIAYTQAKIIIKSGSGLSSVRVEPHDPDADRLPIGSVYQLDVTATQIETLDKVTLSLDLNNASSWELEGMTLAAGFGVTSAVQSADNIATIVIERTGEVISTGETILATIPVRTWTSSSDKSPAELVRDGVIWAQSVEIALEKGEVTYVDSYGSEVFGAFGMNDISVDTELFFNYSEKDSTEGANEWLNSCISAGVGFHEHTPVAIADKAGNCQEAGYTGRSFCYGCDSVVKWGETTLATGHIYKVKNGQLVCVCGDVKTGTGLVELNGKSCYLVNGKLLGGWVSMGGSWYYFDTKTYTSVDTYNNGYVTFEFYPDGKLVSGVWYHSAAGHKYYEGPDCLKGGSSCMTWYTIDGKDYCIDKDGYVATGTRWVDDQNDASDTYTWYIFDEYGACQGKWNYTGLARWNGNHYYVKNGVSQYGMYKVDGEYYYFYFSNKYAGIKNQSFYCGYTKGLLPVGTYFFDAEGRMLNDDVYAFDGVLYYFKTGVKSQGTGSVDINGNSYAIASDGKVLYTGLFKGPDQKTHYYENGVEAEWIKNGIIRDDDGEVRYYVDSVATYAGLIRDVEDNGAYYYIHSDLKAVKNCSFTVPESMTNGLLPAGTYQFGDDGKMIDPPYVECATHTFGNWVIVTSATYTSEGYKRRDCKLCDVYEELIIPKVTCTAHVWSAWTVTVPSSYTETGIETRSCTLCTLTETQIVPVKVCTHIWGAWVIHTQPTASSAGVEGRGCTECGKTETQQIPASSVKNGLIKDSNGDVRYYVDGKATRAGLVRDNEGNFYYINSSLKAVKNCSYSFAASMANGLLPAGTYKFDATGKLIDPPVTKCRAHYWGEWKTADAAGLEIRKCCYCGTSETRELSVHTHSWSAWTVTVPATEDTVGTETRSCSCGEKETREIPKLPHTHIWGEWVVTTPASYTSEGVETRTCPKCGASETRNIPMLICTHSWGEWVVSTPATETSTGVQARECTLCGEKETAEIPLLEHTHVWSDWIVTVPATYTSVGAEVRTCAGCGETETREIPMLICTEHIWSAWTVTTPATETSVGIESRTCANCGEAETREIPILEHVHVWSSWLITAPASYTVSGVESRACVGCGEAETRETPKLLCTEHIWSYTITAPASYTSAGEMTAVCANCGAVEIEEIPMLVCAEHIWGIWTVKSAASYEEAGIEARACAVCNATEEREIPMLGVPGCTHTWGGWIIMTEATTTSAGVQTRGCTQCGMTETQSIPVVNPNATKNGIVKDANGDIRYYENGVAVKSKGLVIYNGDYYYINSTSKAVKNCTYSFNAARANGLLPAGTYKFDAQGRIIDPPVADCKAHFWAEWTVITPATDTEAGLQSRDCYYCKASEKGEISPLSCAHSWSVWTVVSSATEDTVGNEIRLCTLCGETEARDIPTLDHTHVWSDWLITAPASYIEKGIESRACPKCGETETKEIPMFTCTEHIWSSWTVKTPASESTVGLEERTCADCAVTESRRIPMLDHTHVWSNWLLTTPASYTNIGVETRTCAGCGEAETREIPMLICTEHIMNWVVTTPASYTSKGIETGTCANCKVSETRELPMLICAEHIMSWIVTTPASYTSKGIETGTCTNCKASDTREIPMLICAEHIMSWVVTTPASYTSKGIETGTCVNCGATDTREIPMLVCSAHIWGDWVVTTPATTSTGIKTRSCTVCGVTETQIIEKLPDPNAPKNGLVWDPDGNIRYYENGVAVKSKGLVEYEGNYYYINSSSKAVKNCTYSFNAARANGLLPAGTYQFDAEGRLILK